MVCLFVFCCFFADVSPSTPPVPRGRQGGCGRRHVENRILSHGRADVVQVDAQHDQYGEEGEAEAEGPEAVAAQEEAEPVDQPAAQREHTGGVDVHTAGIKTNERLQGIEGKNLGLTTRLKLFLAF